MQKSEHSREAVRDRLIREHFEIEPDIDLIVEIVGPPENGQPEPIRLLEVSKSTTEDGVHPIYFAADAAHGIDWPSVIVEVSPGEYADIQSGKLLLRDNWQLDKSFQRPVASKGVQS